MNIIKLLKEVSIALEGLSKKEQLEIDIVSWIKENL